MSLRNSKVFRGITAGVCWLYAISMIGFVILWVALPQLPSFLALIGSFAPFLFVPIPLVLLLARLTRSKSVLLAGMIVSVLFVGLYGSLFLPRIGQSACQASQELRVMTFNLGMHLGQPEELARIIVEQEADIVAVQEMTPEMARLFEHELGSVYPYIISAPGTETTGLFSQHPILEQEWIEPAGGGRSYVRAVAAWQGRRVTIFVVHPLPPGLDWFRDTAIPIGLNDVDPQRQIEEVTRRAASVEGPVLILGDFNMGAYSRGYDIIAEEFVDAHREAGWGFGFTFPRGLRVSEMPVPGPFIRVDYVFHSRDLCANRTWVGCGGGSDHCYVLTELTPRIEGRFCYANAAQPVAQADAAIAAVVSGRLGRVGGGQRDVSGKAAAQLSSTVMPPQKTTESSIGSGYSCASATGGFLPRLSRGEDWRRFQTKGGGGSSQVWLLPVFRDRSRQLYSGFDVGEKRRP